MKKLLRSLSLMLAVLIGSIITLSAYRYANSAEYKGNFTKLDSLVFGDIKSFSGIYKSNSTYYLNNKKSKNSPTSNGVVERNLNTMDNFFFSLRWKNDKGLELSYKYLLDNKAQPVKIMEFIFNGESIDINDIKKNQGVIMKEINNVTIPSIKTFGAKTGTILPNLNLKIGGLDCVLKRTVRGLTQFEGQKALLINNVGSSEMFNIKPLKKLFGYEIYLLDIGIIVKRNVTREVFLNGTKLIDQVSQSYSDIISTFKAKNNISPSVIQSRLSKLKKLLDLGLITKEEAARKRKVILDSL